MTHALSATPTDPAADDSLSKLSAPTFPVFDDPRVSFAASSPPGPIVVVKRRRLSSSPAATADGDPGSGDAAEGAGASAKAPKVFRLTTPSAAPPEAASAALAADAAPVSSARRRRRDAIRAPLLVRHEVFEQPKAAHDAAPSFVAGAAGDDTPCDYQAVMGALQRVRKELEIARSAQLFRL